MQILAMKKWQSKILDAVAWMIGMRGEHVYCITINLDEDGLRDWADSQRDKEL